MMALYTTYLGFLNRNDAYVGFVDGKPKAIEVNGEVEKAEFLYVMRNRGNNDLAPTEQLLKSAKSGEIDWNEYRHRYLEWIARPNALRRMKEIGERAKNGNIVLVCYEKDSFHCHRRLLANAIAKWSGCEYRGELGEVNAEP